jgi:hypothetical protein
MDTGLQLHLDRDLIGASVAARQPPTQTLVQGSGWGALESLRRDRAGETALADAGTPFTRDTIGEDQQPWLELLTGSARSKWAGRDEPPHHNVKGSDWSLRLEALGDGWLPTYVRGLLAHAEQNPSEARLLFERSMSERPNAWALRALALIEVEAGDSDRGADLYLKAHALSPASEALTIEAAETLLAAGRPSQALTVLRESRSERTRQGRIRLLEAQALAHMGETALVREMLEEGLEVADLREGEDGLHALWHTVFPDDAVPQVYDFRMRSTALPLQ